MTKRTGYIRAIRLLVVSALLFASAACTREDWSDCDPLLRISFSFTRNPDGTEQFNERLTRLDVFIFDSEGRFVQSQTDEKARFPEGYAMEVELPREGSYTIVTVGNMSDSYQMGELVDYSSRCVSLEPGVSVIDDFRLIHNDTGSTSGTILNDIFHGFVSGVYVKTDVTGHCTVQLTKNTKTMDITVSGLHNKVKRSAYPTVDAMARGHNGSCLFDNTPDGKAPEILYLPYSRATEGTDLNVKISVLRITTSCTMPFIITDNGREIGNFDLITEILKSPDYNSDEDLDREDTYKINITFDSAGSVTIEVNGWKTTNSGGIVRAERKIDL